MRVKVKASVTKTVDNTAALDLTIKSLISQRVLVGIPEEKEHREEGSNNATIAYVQDRGSPLHNIPPRPFLIPGIRSVHDQISARLKKVGEDVFKRRGRGLEDGLRAIGAIAAAAVRDKIVEGPFAPLAPQTAARRRQMGKGTAPLNVSGQLRRAISYYLEEL